VDPKVGGRFTAWDEYIEGTTEELEMNQRIVQRWRTTDFPNDSPDSLVEIILEAVEKGTKMTLIHSEIPDGQKESYKKGWKDFYFSPMKEYFG
ncbi:MAG: SRPBCC domain-containing protein, partial [Candidatus Thorarchaeota archaeon]